MKALARLIVLLCVAVALCVGGGATASAVDAGSAGRTVGISGPSVGHGEHLGASGHESHPTGRKTGLNGDCHDAASHCCAAGLPWDGWQAPSHAPCPMRRGSAPRAAMALNLPELDLPPPRA